MKYAMTIEVEAEQFLPDEDKIPAGVQSDGPRSPKVDPRSSWILVDSIHGTKYMKPGEYVITNPDGSRYSVDGAFFEANYKPIGE